MNRTTALLLAMATLLAHALAIHLDVAGRLGQPYEVAHQAFHLARNFVREGELVWNVGAEGIARGGLEAYPAPLWVALVAIAEQLYLPVNLFAQMVGLGLAVWTVSLSARFEIDRIAGVIPALLLVTSGGFAASALSGTEIPLVALLSTTAFVAFEQRNRLALGIALGLLVFTRPEGVVIAVVYLMLALHERSRSGRRELVQTAVWPFLPAAAVAFLLILTPAGHGGSLYGALLSAMFLPDSERLASGLGYLWDFVATAVTPLLLVFPLGALVVGRLSGTGRRALILGAAWTALVVLEGGGPQPFTLAMVPALPLFVVAIQQGVIAAIDTRYPAFERVAWAMLLGSTLFGAFASRFPGNVGPIKVRDLHARWMEASCPPPYAMPALRGRPALGAEIRRTAELRDLAKFLRENVDGNFSIMTPWPGAMGYLSRMQVFDLMGRVTAPPGKRLNPPWVPRPRIDLVAALEEGADFILPGILDYREVAKDGLWMGVDLELREMDLDPSSLERVSRLKEALTRYELVTLPVLGEREGRRGVPRLFYLLRRRSLRLAPELMVGIEEGELFVDVRQTTSAAQGGGHLQLAHLEVIATDDEGGHWFVNPNAELSDEGRLYARVDLRLEPGSERPTRLFSGTLGPAPSGAAITEVRARLYNPVLKKSHPFAPVSAAARLRLP